MDSPVRHSAQRYSIQCEARIVIARIYLFAPAKPAECWDLACATNTWNPHSPLPFEDELVDDVHHIVEHIVNIGRTEARHQQPICY